MDEITPAKHTDSDDWEAPPEYSMWEPLPPLVPGAYTYSNPRVGLDEAFDLDNGTTGPDLDFVHQLFRALQRRRMDTTFHRGFDSDNSSSDAFSSNESVYVANGLDLDDSLSESYFSETSDSASDSSDPDYSPSSSFDSDESAESFAEENDSTWFLRFRKRDRE